MPRKKTEAEPKAVQPPAASLLFQAPDLPTPEVDSRSGKLKAEIARPPKQEESEPRKRKRTKTPEQKPEEKKTDDSTRVDSKRQRRREPRNDNRRRSSISESEFLARRESVDRKMIVREADDRVQIGVLEDAILVEHYVAQSQSASLIGNIYLGKVQNVLPSMEAAFVDIGKGRNAVLYSGEVDWDAAETGNQPRKIELALKTGDKVLVQVTKDPVGQKGARLTSQISLPGRYLVYVPGGNMNGISRKLPDKERQRLKGILKELLPADAGVIVRTAAEGATEEQLALDVKRLTEQWQSIGKKSEKGKAPSLLHTESDQLIKIIRDVFNEDFQSMVVQGAKTNTSINEYLESVAPELKERLSVHKQKEDIFDAFRIGDQIHKALERKVYLPSGGSLVIDRTEAMTVVDVNTGKFIGSGGNLEETVTKNNLEAAEELVRQLRLRDIGGIIVVDFIDMTLESNREQVQRRLMECLSRDRTKHQVAEVTSLGLIQMTRKKLGVGLLETFGEVCDCCAGRGMTITEEQKYKAEQKSSKAKPETKKIVDPEKAKELGSMVNKIHDAAAGDEPEKSEETGNILDKVLDSLPEAEETKPKKPRRRRVTSKQTTPNVDQ
ncbi:MAG: Rne/Rng family ribonuclease [Microbacteriaceae bacterium]|nr:Rne/Rng family ribonuclease [Microbacteriaceae bacterium]MDR9443613.1 Rne/Rng family ribonuclease [Microbacteriaceae bacterium]